MASTSWDRRGEAHAVLHAIVSDPDYGVAALSSPQAMSSLLKDLLPDAPREAGVLVAAAEAGLAKALAGYRAQGMDLGTATALAVRSFAARTAFTADACHWAVSELAAAAGFDTGGAGRAGDQPPPAAAPQPTAPPRDRQHATTAAAGSARTTAGAGLRSHRAAGGPKRAAAGREISHRGLKGWRARRGLLLLIAIPTMAAVALGGIRTASSIQSANAYQAVETLANLGQQIIVLTQALEEERDQTAFYIALGPNGGRTTGALANPAVRSQAALEQSVVTRSKNATDQAMATVSDLSSQIGGSYSAQTQQAAATARAALGELPYLRTVSISTELPALVVVQKYTQLIDDVLALNDQIAQSASDPQLAQTVRVLGLVSAMKEEASQQRAILAAALIQGKFGPGELDALNTAQSAQQSNLAAFDISADVGQRLLWNNSVNGSFTYLANSEELQALTLQNNSGSLRADPTSAVDWFGAMSNTIDFQMSSIERALTSQVTARAGIFRRDAMISGVTAGVFIAVLALLFAVVLGPSAAQPLQRRRRGFAERRDQRPRLARDIENLNQERDDAATLPSRLDMSMTGEQPGHGR